MTEQEFLQKKREVKQLSPLTLAFIGDAVYEVLVRTHIIEQGNAPVHKLHFGAVNYVKATAQAQAVRKLEAFLSEEEKDMVRRGRNATSVTVPKNADPIAYRMATGLEALFGFLYFTEQHERIAQLMMLIFAQTKEGKL